MADPRWTIDEKGDLVVPIDLSGVGRRRTVLRRHEFHGPAFDALVAALRDADTLRQAREIADRVKTKGPVPTTSLWWAELQELVDLLSSPVSPDTPTPTGQT